MLIDDLACRKKQPPSLQILRYLFAKLIETDLVQCECEDIFAAVAGYMQVSFPRFVKALKRNLRLFPGSGCRYSPRHIHLNVECLEGSSLPASFLRLRSGAIQ